MKALRILRTIGLTLLVSAFVLATATSCDSKKSRGQSSDDEETSSSVSESSSDKSVVSDDNSGDASISDDAIVSEEEGYSDEVVNAATTVKSAEVNKTISRLLGEFEQVRDNKDSEKYEEIKKQLLYWVEVKLYQVNEEIDKAYESGDTEEQARLGDRLIALGELKERLEK